jgi:hypothetical protein
MLASPRRAPAFLARLAQRWLTLDQMSRGMPAPDVVLVGYLGHFDVHLARLLFRRSQVVLDHLVGASETGRDRQLDGGPRHALLKMIDAAALRAADIIVVDTEEHRATLPERHRARAVVVPVGAPAAWHAAARPADLSDAPEPLRWCSTGCSPRYREPPSSVPPWRGSPGSHQRHHDRRRPGRGRDKAAAAANQAVRWLGWVPAAELPALVASHHVCLGIFGTGDKALQVVPNKVFQGAAAGCAIVTSDTPPQRRTLGDAAVLVPPGDPAALAAALLGLAGDRSELARMRRLARQLAGRRFTPEQIVAPLVERLQVASGASPPAQPSPQAQPYVKEGMESTRASASRSGTVRRHQRGGPAGTQCVAAL